MKIQNNIQSKTEIFEPTALQKEIIKTLHEGKKAFLLKDLKNNDLSGEISTYAVHPDGILCYSEKEKILWFEEFCSDEILISHEEECSEIQLYFDHIKVKLGSEIFYITLNGKISMELKDYENPPYIPEWYHYLASKMKHHAYEKEFNQLFPNGEVLAYHPSGLILESDNKIYFYITEPIKACID